MASTNDQVNVAAGTASSAVAPPPVGEEDLPPAYSEESNASLQAANNLLALANAALIKCLKTYSKHLLQTHWLILAYAGVEIRTNNIQNLMRSAEQKNLILDGYIRWIDLYQEKVLDGPPGNPNMFKMPVGVSPSVWRNALILQQDQSNKPVNGKGLLKKFNDQFKARCHAHYALAWQAVFPANFPNGIRSGISKWDLLAELQVYTQEKPDNKDYWAWINLGPFGMDAELLRAPLPPEGGPFRTAADFARKNTAERITQESVGRQQHRQQLRQTRVRADGTLAYPTLLPAAGLPSTRGVTSPTSQALTAISLSNANSKRLNAASNSIKEQADLLHATMEILSKRIERDSKRGYDTSVLEHRLDLAEDECLEKNAQWSAALELERLHSAPPTQIQRTGAYRDANSSFSSGSGQDSLLPSQTSQGSEWYSEGQEAIDNNQAAIDEIDALAGVDLYP
jgi:hypothetical protein